MKFREIADVVLVAALTPCFVFCVSALGGFSYKKFERRESSHRVGLTLLLQFHDQHAFAVAAGVCDPVSFPTESDFRRLIGQKYQFCVNDGHGERKSDADDDFWNGIMQRVGKYLSQADSCNPPMFLFPPFSSYGHATPEAVASCHDDDELEKRFKLAFSSPFVEQDGIWPLSTVLEKSFDNLQQQCPEIEIQMLEHNNGVEFSGAAMKSSPIHTWESIVGRENLGHICSSQTENLYVCSNQSPNELLEMAKLFGLVRFQLNSTNFSIFVPNRYVNEHF